MNPADQTDQTTLSACGCCGAPSSTPALANDPGLPALAYRIGTYASFYRRMLAQIHSPRTIANPPAGPWALAALATRSPDDPAIALMDAWAVVADVLTFYQERIANEGFLGTATERLSILYLARAIGYSLNPGVAASTYLAFTIEDVIGTPSATALPQAVRSPSVQTQGAVTYNPGIVTIPSGTAVRSMPAQGGLPQTFETEAALNARPGWNILLPRLTRPADLALTADGTLWLLGLQAGFAGNAPTGTLYPQTAYVLSPDTPPIPAQGILALPLSQIYVAGTSTGLAAGDWLLLAGANASGATFACSRRVWDVAALPALNQTCIDLAASQPGISFQPVRFPAGTVPAGPTAFNQFNVATYVLDTTIAEADLQTIITMNGWDPADLATVANTVPAPTPGREGVFSFATTLGFFGHNAPKWKATTTPTALRGDPAPLDWDAANHGLGQLVWTDSQGSPNIDATVFLERTTNGILPGDWMMIGAPALQPVPFQVTAATQKSLADYGLSGKTTGLSLESASGAPLQAVGSPAAAVAASNWIDIFAIGLDGHLHHQGGTTGDWMSTLEDLGGGNFAAPPAVVRGGPSPIEIFMIGTDGNLYHAGWNGWFWWAPLIIGGGGLLTGTPSVVTNYGNPIPGNPLDVFATGTDGHLYHFWFYNGAWNGPEDRGIANASSGARFTGNPCLVNRGSSYLEIFGVATDGYIYHFGCTTGYNWFATQSVLPIGGAIRFAGSPSVSVGPNPGRTGINTTDVFAIGVDGILYHAWYEVTPGWQGTPQGGSFVYENRGGGFLINSPCLVTNGPSPLEVFAIGNDGNLYHTWWNNLQWYPLASLGGGNLVGTPSATLNGPHPIDVFATSQDGSLWHAWFDGNYWHTPENIAQGNLQPFPVRKSTAYVNSSQLQLAELPVTDDLNPGDTSLMLNGMVLGLEPEQAIALTGLRADAPGVTASEVVLLAGVLHTGGYTLLEFTTGLQYGYQRQTLTLTANVVAATHGGTISVSEVVGSGEATQANQSFPLKQAPLTYISAPTATGSDDTLAIRVNDLLWTEAPSLYGLGPNDQSYMLRQNNDGTTTLTFGDGVSGARVPTGQNNITALYRTGLGTPGNIDAGAISILQSRPAGVRAASNPVAASGGADAENLASAAVNAPRTVLTLDRIVSLADYEDFAQSFAGIGKAQAMPLQVGGAEIAFLTIGGIAGAAVPVTSQLFLSLSAAIDAARPPVQQSRIGSYRPVLVNLNAAVRIDTPRFLAAEVLANVLAALAATFAFNQRGFGQPLTAAEVVTAIQSVPGVIATDLNQLYRNGDPSGPLQIEPLAVVPAASAQVLAGQPLPAELLLLNPLGTTITARTA